MRHKERGVHRKETGSAGAAGFRYVTPRNGGVRPQSRTSMSVINSAQDLWLGLDTGGTFTDAVLLADGRRVIASAKALTTPWNLAIGIGKAIRAVLELLPAGARREGVSLVSVSTTLATNAVVENRFSPVCTLLIGFDDAMVERSGLQSPGSGGAVVRIQGGHTATGEESVGARRGSRGKRGRRARSTCRGVRRRGQFFRAQSGA